MAVNDHYTLEAKEIRKSFSGISVLHGVNFSLKKGEIHGLAGANGAGKSTLMKILNGVYRKDTGEILIDGRPVDISSPLDAAALGIAMVFQEFSLVPTMTVSENVFLAMEPKNRYHLVDHKKSKMQTTDILKSLEIDINPDEYVGNLPVGTQQIVEIAKALRKECSVLILDEPTASLSTSEIQLFFSILKKLKEKKISIIMITHHLQEIMDICDRVTVLRDGDVAFNRSIDSIELNDIITALMGQNIDKHDFVSLKKSAAFVANSKPCLEVKNLAYRSILNDISFDLREGEVLGIAGLLGSGRTELLKSIYGLIKPDKGSIKINGQPVQFRHPADARIQWVSFVPENRHKHGIIKGQSITNNIMLPVWPNYSRKKLIINTRKANTRTNELIKKLKIKAQIASQLIEQLSGGNQQKAVMGKAIVGNVEILLLDEPTVGVDISSKQEILAAIRELADEAKAVLMVSSEMNELVQICDRVLVVKNGKLFYEFNQHDDTRKLTEDILVGAIQGFLSEKRV